MRPFRQLLLLQVAVQLPFQYCLVCRYAVSKEGKRHHLVVRRVGVEDFANYSCHASNSLGRTKQTIQLRGQILI